MMLNECLAHAAKSVTGVLHLGAHLGQEAPDYERHGIKNVVWVEANPQLIEPLTKNVGPYGHRVIEAAVWGTAGAEMTFNIASHEGESSSLLEFDTHAQHYPTVTFVDSVKVTTTSLHQLSKDHDLKGINFLYMDLQGAESIVLSGGHNFLRQIDFIYSEVNFETLYKFCGTVETLENWIPNFTCIALASHEFGWGDAFYQRFKSSALDLRTKG